MEHSVLFYCVKCEQLKTMEQAGLLFRTGYYRVLYPLGCCVHCEIATRSV
ncbi:hypothetical protein [Cohnella herbarum]|uniref:Uncharacterized protein n=1 Tax=Cohnella herbarum TaxID=2728023 RepID=A0A7Z2VQ47_9BACL|nr:hypothetical protein [Cohnella herbarum]QJD87174.1 hypothetical protein HH215_31030 [Cohnella herbarum]